MTDKGDIYGVIDVGSNTIRLCIYNVTGDRITAMLNNKITAGLIGYVEDGVLSDRGIRRACDVLNTHRMMAERVGVKELFVFATASLRNIDNREEAVAEIERETGLDVDVISGLDEAMLDFEGAAHVMELSDGLMVDIGGGSTELVLFRNNVAKDAVSINIGSLSMFRNNVSGLFPGTSEVKAIKKKTLAELDKVKFLHNERPGTILGIGGTIRAVKKFNNDHFGLSKDNSEIRTGYIRDMLHDLQGSEKKTLRKILQVTPDRVHTLIPGMLILDTICEKYGCRRILMSSFGVREGYLYKKVVMNR